jgi:hypothetical protein
MTNNLRDFQTRLLLTLHGIAAADLRRPEAEGKWSILDVIAHISDLELLTATRVRLALAQDEPPLPGFEQDQWVARIPGRESLAAVIEQFGFLRRGNLALYDRMSADERARCGQHPSYGLISINEMFERVERHQEHHLGQIERIKTTHGLGVTLVPHLAGIASARAGDARVRTFAPGVRARDLWQDGARRALQVEIDACAEWPGLDHHVPGPEEVFVVAGDFEDQGVTYPPGTFLHYPAGTSHSPRSTMGCTLFVFYPEG